MLCPRCAIADRVPDAGARRLSILPFAWLSRAPGIIAAALTTGHWLYRRRQSRKAAESVLVRLECLARYIAFQLVVNLSRAPVGQKETACGQDDVPPAPKQLSLIVLPRRVAGRSARSSSRTFRSSCTLFRLDGRRLLRLGIATN